MLAVMTLAASLAAEPTVPPEAGDVPHRPARRGRARSPSPAGDHGSARGFLDGGWHLDTTVGTDLPIDVSGRLALETPGGLRLFGEVGGMPAAYFDAANAVVVAAGGYDATVGAALTDTLDGALTVSGGLGLRPLPRRGLVIDVGYTWLRFRGESVPATYSAAVGLKVPAGSAAAASLEAPWGLRTAVHQVDARIGWLWEPARHVLVRLDVGGAFTVGARTDIARRDGQTSRGLEADVAAQASDLVDLSLRAYGHTPTVGLSIGYRWF